MTRDGLMSDLRAAIAGLKFSPLGSSGIAISWGGRKIAYIGHPDERWELIFPQPQKHDLTQADCWAIARLINRVTSRALAYRMRHQIKK